MESKKWSRIFPLQTRPKDILSTQHTNFLGAESKTPDLGTLWREQNDAVTVNLGHSSNTKMPPLVIGILLFILIPKVMFW